MFTEPDSRQRPGRGPVLLVMSPHAGSAVGEKELARMLTEAGVTVGRPMLVTDLGREQPRGAEWSREGLTAVVAAGGDGTVGGVATHLSHSGLPMGILPMGTSNNVARALGLPLDLAAACAAIGRGVPTPIDAGQVLPWPPPPGVLADEIAADLMAADSLSAASTLAGQGAYFLHGMTQGSTSSSPGWRPMCAVAHAGDG